MTIKNLQPYLIAGDTIMNIYYEFSIESEKTYSKML